MSANSHGHTPAAWTAVTIMMIGFLIGSIAVVLASPTLVVVGLVVVVAGLVVGGVMRQMGLGQKPRASARQGSQPARAEAS
ncbi:HGxxPAAW family protein [Allostreptomyces psammosilenae]|uniref:Nucleoside recognition membrane protein YjiH n=1 Tax=Allostreptomyces psammosilenae TaxID=1892865 RepID=A0A852ZYJ7_9ACTN|nr:HGxxPAAW family protein [Allostreptomyces psammosilenae]NYI07145.1 nucleoside recognition membrane protein YjiH [Allostreptomyces psammosilenae]